MKYKTKQQNENIEQTILINIYSNNTKHVFTLFNNYCKICIAL